jgi:TatD DNase family protein
LNKNHRGAGVKTRSSDPLIMPTFTDTHCHLNFHSFAEDLPAVIQRAIDQSHTRIMLPGTDLASSLQGIEIAKANPLCFAAVGVHPNDANQWETDTAAKLKTLATIHPEVHAIGEIGLDFYRDWTTPEQQRICFLAQLALAEELCLPVIIHIRDALSETFEILFAWQARLAAQEHPLANRPGILHAFPGTLEEALRGFEHQFKIGVGGPVTFKNAKDRQEVVKQLPLEAILLETDAPFLTPHPHRGKRNEPAYIPLIAEKIAELHEASVETVSKVTTANAEFVFQW